MIESIILDRSFDVLEKGLNASATRHSVIANNIANVDTPGFKISDVSFETELARALDKGQLRGSMTNRKHIPLGAPNLEWVKPTITKENDTQYRNDENNVDVEVEMSKLAKNQMKYNAMAKRIADQFKLFKSVIAESGR